MRPSFPYGPDRSLLLAIALLGSGALLAAGGLYVVSDLLGGGSAGGGAIASSGAARPAAPSVRPAPSRTPSPPLAGGSVPAWARSSGTPASASPPAPGPGGAYDLRADLGHADLGAPSPSSGAPAPGAASARPGGSADAPATASSARSTPVRRSQTSNSPSWRAEASELSGNLQALSQALAARASSEASTDAKTSAKTSSSDRGTASSSNAPTPPGDDPNNEVPLGGAEWLAAAGAAYAIRRLSQSDTSDA